MNRKIFHSNDIEDKQKISCCISHHYQRRDVQYGGNFFKIYMAMVLQYEEWSKNIIYIVLIYFLIENLTHQIKPTLNILPIAHH